MSDFGQGKLVNNNFYRTKIPYHWELCPAQLPINIVKKTKISKFVIILKARHISTYKLKQSVKAVYSLPGNTAI